MYKRLIISIFSCVVALIAMAQEAPYKFDFGGNVGMSGYIGDANGSPLFKHPGFTIDAGARYFPNVRWAFRGLLSATSLSGDTKDMENFVPGDVDYKFSSMVYSVEVRAEFNFFPYGIGETYKKLKRCTPYLMLGIGGCMASGDGNVPVAFSLPMGFGLKYKLRPRLNLAVEYSMTKVFSDKVDSEQLADLTGIKTSFFKNTDWYSRITIGLSYEFGERCETCHYVD